MIFTSDNGPWLSYGDHAGAAPLREGKGTCWEGGVRVPCVMRWPGKIPAGTESDAMLMTIDLFPTIAHLTQADLPNHRIDGLDVWPLISGTAWKIEKPPRRLPVLLRRTNSRPSPPATVVLWKLQLPHTYRTPRAQCPRRAQRHACPL